MSLANRLIICKKLQFLVTNAILSIRIFRNQGSEKLLQSNLFGFKIQDSRLRKNFFNPTSLDSRSKIQGSEKTSSIQPLWIQESRFKAQKKLLQSNLFGFKIHGSEKTSSIQPLWNQDSRFKAQKKLLQFNLFGFKIQDSRLRKNFFNSTSLDSRSKVQGAEKTSSIQPPWIQDPRFKAQKKLLQSNPFGFKIQDPRLRKNFFNPTSLESRFKIQGSEKTSSTQPLWIQDSRIKAQKKLLQSNLFGFKIQDSRRRKKLLQSNLLGFKVQGSRLAKDSFNPTTSLDSRFKIQGSEKTSSIQPLWIQDPRIKAQKKVLQFNPFGFKIQDSRLRKNFFNPTSLDSRFKIQASGKTFFNPTCLDSKFKIQG